MKSPLAERPIFHHLEHRADTHIFLCVLACHLVVAIEKTLRDGGLWTSWATVRQTLRKHQVGTIVLPAQNGWTLRIRRDARPHPEIGDLYDRLGVPRRILAPSKPGPGRPTPIVTENQPRPPKTLAIQPPHVEVWLDICAFCVDLLSVFLWPLTSSL